MTYKATIQPLTSELGVTGLVPAQIQPPDDKSWKVVNAMPLQTQGGPPLLWLLWERADE